MIVQPTVYEKDPNWSPIVTTDFAEMRGHQFHAAVREFREAIKDRPRASLDLRDGWHTITPQIAEQLLMRNTRNRPLDSNYVYAYGSQMINGRWKLTGEPVIINGGNKDVDDAGHRLWACYLSGADFTTYLVNIPDDPDAFAFIDSGRSRSGSDALITAGIGEQSRLAAQVIKQFAMPFDENCLSYTGRLPLVAPCTSIDILDYVRANPSMTETIRMIIETYPAGVKRLYSKQVAAFVGWKIHSIHGARVLDDFFTILAQNNLPALHPVLILQNRLDAHLAGHAASRASPKRKDILTPTRILALTIRAFNLWVAGQSARRLDPRADDTFPEFAEPKELPLADAAE